MTASSRHQAPFLPGHPLRRPDWRWFLSRLYFEQSQVTAAVGPPDQYVAALAGLRRRLSATCGRMSSRRNMDDLRAAVAVAAAGPMGLAYEFWDEGDEAPPGSASALARAELEARVLANESPAAIARRFGFEAAVVEWYERAFFDVRSRLDNPGFICHSVIGPLVHRGMTDRDIPALIRAYGYHTRSPALISFVATTFEGGIAGKGKTVAQLLAADGRATMRRKSALAARMLPLNAFTQVSVLELHQKATEMAQRVEIAAMGAKQLPDVTDPGNTQIEANVQEFAQRIDWGVKEPPGDGELAPPAVEPRQPRMIDLSDPPALPQGPG